MKVFKDRQGELTMIEGRGLEDVKLDTSHP